MKRIHLILLWAAAGLIAFQFRGTTIYAAPGEGGSSTQTSQSQATEKSAVAGAEEYAAHCAICHGDNREGNLPAFPPLVGISRQLNEQQITEIVHNGRGRMPGFPKLEDKELSALLQYLGTNEAPAQTASSNSSGASSDLASAGEALFRQNCAFCHGRDAQGGETGPDLTQSKVVRRDVGGNRISEVVRNGRPEKKMPAFHFSNQEMFSLVAFIHEQQAKAISRPGGRRGVEAADLQTGNVEAGKQYFNGAGNCASCHSPTGDLAGVATRYEGLQLEEQMLYPRDVKSRVVVTLPSGQQVSGTVAYLDEFTVALRDASGNYRSWPISKVKYKLDAPVNGHVEQFSKYTDADIHNLMAYLQTLR